MFDLSVIIASSLETSLDIAGLSAVALKVLMGTGIQNGIYQVY